MIARSTGNLVHLGTRTIAEAIDPLAAALIVQALNERPQPKRGK